MTRQKLAFILLTLALLAPCLAQTGTWRQTDVRHRGSRSSGTGPLQFEYIVAGNDINRVIRDSGTVLRSENFTWLLDSTLTPGKVVNAWVAANGNGKASGWDGGITLEGLSGGLLVANSMRNERQDNTTLTGPAAGSPGATLKVTVWVGVGNEKYDYAVDYIYVWEPARPTPGKTGQTCYYDVGVIDEAGNRSGVIAPPWIIYPDGKIAGPGVWHATYTVAGDGSLDVTLTMDSNGAQDRFTIKRSKDGFIAYKDGKPYRWGKLTRKE